MFPPNPKPDPHPHPHPSLLLNREIRIRIQIMLQQLLFPPNNPHVLPLLLPHPQSLSHPQFVAVISLIVKSSKDFDYTVSYGEDVESVTKNRNL